MCRFESLSMSHVAQFRQERRLFNYNYSLWLCYSPQTKLREGNVFTVVCLSTGGVSQHSPGQGFVWKVYTPLTHTTTHTPTPETVTEAGGTGPNGMHAYF